MRQSVRSEGRTQFLRKEKESLARMQLHEPFLFVMAGEFNVGKSALVNALLGGHILCL